MFILAGSAENTRFSGHVSSLLSFSFFTVVSYAVSPLNVKRDCHHKKIYSCVFYLSIYYKYLVRHQKQIYFLCYLDAVVKDVCYDCLHLAKLYCVVSLSLHI